MKKLERFPNCASMPLDGRKQTSSSLPCRASRHPGTAPPVRRSWSSGTSHGHRGHLEGLERSRPSELNAVGRGAQAVKGGRVLLGSDLWGETRVALAERTTSRATCKSTGVGPQRPLVLSNPKKQQACTIGAPSSATIFVRTLSGHRRTPSKTTALL